MKDSSRIILVLIGSLDVGGAERHLSRVLPRLQSVGWKVVVLPWWRGGPLCATLRSTGVEVLESWASRISCKSKIIRLTIGVVLAFAQISSNLFRHRKGAVSFYLPQSYWIGAPLAILFRCRIRIMNRRSSNNYFGKLPLFFRYYEMALHRKMSVIVGNSSFIIKDLISEGVKHDKIKLIFNGIEMEDWKFDHGARLADRLNLDLSSDHKILVCVANLIPYKGHADLIAALSRLQWRQDWRLLIVGSDPLGLSREFAALAASLGIEDKILFLGPRHDIPRILNASDIGVLASHEEGLPNAVLEYMAAGLPVIATSVGGMPDLVVDGETGLLVPPLAPDDLFEATQALLESPDMRRRFGAAGRRRVEQAFGVDVEVSEYDRLYATLAVG